MTENGELAGRILTYLRQDANRPLKAKELARALGVADDSYGGFRSVLRELEGDGLVYRGRRGRYATPDNINLAVGRIQITRAGDGFVSVPGGDDVFVRGNNLATAVEGDTVVARVERRRPGRNPEGRVIRVLQRAWHQVVGVYHRKESYGFVIPQEPPLTADLFIPPGEEGEATEGQMVMVGVLEWGERELSPVGRVERVLGTPGEAGVDVLAILLGHQLPLDFPAAVTSEAESVAAAGLRADEGMREDLRDRLVFTIDPEDAKDHDDALSWTRTADGSIEVGVHIADVSHYVPEGGVLDREALERGTSVYLVDRVVPMLPHELSSDLASLKPDEDRLAISLLLTVGNSGEIIASRLARTVIRSSHRLSYDQAQGILDGGPAGSEELSSAVNGLYGFSRKLRRQRESRGSIDFDLPEARVVLNTAGEPTDIQRVFRLGAHELVEDMMILANETVASLAISERVPILFRVHEEPKEDRIEILRGLAATFGHQLPHRKLKPKDLAKLLHAMDGTPQETLVSTATLRSMKQARYSAQNLRHFGLASPAYAHFTSPIRRYPDLVVHRQLSRWLADPESARKMDVERLETIAERASERERKAVAAERDSVDLKKIQFMERHLGDDFDGTLAGVTAFGMFVLLDDFHVEGLVHVSSLGDDYYVFDEEQHALSGRRTKKRYQLGDRVRVQVVRVDREARQIDFDLLEHRSAAGETQDAPGDKAPETPSRKKPRPRGGKKGQKRQGKKGEERQGKKVEKRQGKKGQKPVGKKKGSGSRKRRKPG